MQRVLYDDAMRSDIEPSVRAQLVRAWCDANVRQWVISMRPSPKSVDVTERRKGRKKVLPVSEEAGEPLPDQVIDSDSIDPM